MSDHTYIHATRRSPTGRYRPSSWHIVRAPLAHSRTYATLCGRTIVSDDTMEELPAAKSCELCLRIANRADERSHEVGLP